MFRRKSRWSVSRCRCRPADLVLVDRIDAFQLLDEGKKAEFGKKYIFNFGVDKPSAGLLGRDPSRTR